jgi:hypothetical protein
MTIRRELIDELLKDYESPQFPEQTVKCIMRT